jgi:hypothetical protein
VNPGVHLFPVAGLWSPMHRELIDQQGMTYYGSWPACLGGPGNATRVTFAEVPVSDPGGSTTRQVVWVDCRP